MAKSYYDKLKDPRWQKKRLEILKRDGFKCNKCKNDKNTLHVHHIQYLKVSSPWDYPNKYLVCLCDDCHQEEELYADKIKSHIVDLFNTGLNNGDISILLCALVCIKKREDINWEKIEEEIIQLATKNEYSVTLSEELSNEIDKIFHD